MFVSWFVQCRTRQCAPLLQNRNIERVETALISALRARTGQAKLHRATITDAGCLDGDRRDPVSAI
jgi:hypothetical protein